MKTTLKMDTFSIHIANSSNNAGNASTCLLTKSSIYTSPHYLIDPMYWRKYTLFALKIELDGLVDYLVFFVCMLSISCWFNSL